VSLCLNERHTMKTHEGVEIQFQAFLTQALDRGEWLTSGPGRFSIGEGAPRFSFHRRKKKKSRPCRELNLGRLAHSQLLYYY
jgi:hypothetical protein